ncbi:glycosyltransferase family 2 protein [Evansella sp. AB-P1]|uniref:glycosyltransferase n=1 Tax=Evansella sp. AB-P1 TaxID=3037653 RepID=UPI00241E23E0|nr:glycosyltransferase family 2 protein [Evansella sp. AB-P1]MDG5788351.1 glycosyltransferase family 2 protein [Evansella sp. AB-P1]
MSKLCLVTFHIHSESFTEAFSELTRKLDESFEQLEVAVFVDEVQEHNINMPIKQIKMPQTTKYKRILSLLDESDADYFLFIDNDIKGDIPKTIRFIKKTMEKGSDIAWGKIMAQKHKGITSKMVAVDKLLSHNVLRPLLWKMKLGVTVPGQCFMIKASSFRNKIDKFDTFLDDISFGLHVQLNHMSVHMDPHVLGYEEPNAKLKNLFKQRKRWAHGFTSIFSTNRKNKKGRFLLSIHTLSYHLSWIPFWATFALIGINSLTFAILFLVISIVLLCRKQLSLVPAALLYSIVFPVLHIHWFRHVVSFYFKQLKGDFTWK